MMCCLVSPEWVDLGWVQWHGHPDREKLFSIRYRRCLSPPAAEPLMKDGFLLHLCGEHRAERQGTSM